MNKSTFMENLQLERSKLLPYLDEKQRNLDEVVGKRNKAESAYRDALSADGRNNATSSPLHTEWSSLGNQYDQIKSELDPAKGRLDEVDRLLSAEAQVQVRREAFLTTQTQLADVKKQKARLDAVHQQLSEELSKETESLQAEMSQHASIQLEARLAGENGASQPRSITSLNISISGKQATLAAAESRKHSYQEEISSLQQCAREQKASYGEARYVLAELVQLAAIEEIKPVLATLLASMRQSGRGYSQTEITITLSAEEIESALTELRNEMISRPDESSDAE